MNRAIAYEWRLQELMAKQRIKNARELTDLLNERGITLTHTAIWRIVSKDPERISLQLLVALCDALDVELSDLIRWTASDTRTARAKRRASGENVVSIGDHRPVRARILGDDSEA